MDKYLIVLKEREFPYRCTDIHVHLDGIEDLCSLILQQQEKFELISVMRFACRPKPDPDQVQPIGPVVRF